jgi:membrane protein
VESMWKLGGLSFFDLLRRTWKEASEDGIFEHSAQLAYYFLLAIFPLLLFVTALLGIFADMGAAMKVELMNSLALLLPSSAFELVRQIVDEVTRAAGGGKISFGILATLWAASNGMGAIATCLNTAFDVPETRSTWRFRLMSVGLTIAVSGLVIVALLLTLFGTTLAEWAAERGRIGNILYVTWLGGQWVIVLSAMLLSLALIYYFAPNIINPKWQWITPGALLGFVLWLAISLVFRFYLRYFDSYSVTYGSLGAVIVLMLWFYLSGAAILFGGEFNSEILEAMRSRNLEGQPVRSDPAGRFPPGWQPG